MKNRELSFLYEIVCVADYFLTGVMERVDFEFYGCLNQFKLFAHNINSLPVEANNAWSMTTKGREHIKIPDIIAKKEYWNVLDAMQHYRRMYHYIQAARKLNMLYYELGGNFKELEQELNLIPWTLVHCKDFLEKTPKPICKALDQFNDFSGVTIKEIKNAVDNNQRPV